MTNNTQLSFNTLFTPEIGKRYSSGRKYSVLALDIMHNPNATVVDRLKVLRQMVCYYYPTYCKMQRIPKSVWYGKYLHELEDTSTIPFTINAATDTSDAAVQALQDWLLVLAQGKHRTVNTAGPTVAEMNWLLGNAYQPMEEQHAKTTNAEQKGVAE